MFSFCLGFVLVIWPSIQFISMSHCIDRFGLYSSLVFSSVLCLSLLDILVFFCLCFASSSILGTNAALRSWLLSSLPARNADTLNTFIIVFQIQLNTKSSSCNTTTIYFLTTQCHVLSMKHPNKCILVNAYCWLLPFIHLS